MRYDAGHIHARQAGLKGRGADQSNSGAQATERSKGKEGAESGGGAKNSIQTVESISIFSLYNRSTSKRDNHHLDTPLFETDK